MEHPFYSLSTVVVLGVLVLIFLSLARQHRTPRFKLWLAAWGIIFVRVVFAPLVPQDESAAGRFFSSLNIAISHVAGVLFLTSVSAVYKDPVLRWRLLASLGVPLVVYSFLYGYRVANMWPYLVTALAFCSAVLAWAAWNRKLNLYVLAMTATTAMAGPWVAVQIVNGRFDIALIAAGTATYAFTGLLFWRQQRRLSPGGLTTFAGFVAWAGVSPLVHDTLWLPSSVQQVELYHIPKFIVGIGMIVTLMEEQFLEAKLARKRERVLNRQMQRFAELTSKLLSGVNVRDFAPHIAAMISMASNYRRCAVILSDEQGTMHLAGHGGLSEQEAARIAETIQLATIEEVASRCRPEFRIANDSYRLRTEYFEDLGALRSQQHFPPNPNWRNGDELIVPLRSPRGNWVGLLSLDDPRDVWRVTREDLSSLELLASDIAVALENSSLHKQLVRSEKLASVGKLTAGMAHELNNPLQAVLGYTEILCDEATDQQKRALEVVRREALRMKRIIENLLRFSRQTRSERRSVNLARALDEVVQLRAYAIRSENVRLKMEVEGDLPHLHADEMQLKQVFIHILNNAIEAVQDEAEKDVTVRAEPREDRVEIRVTDSGPGFPDVHRAFDPFFTTKGVGKGTGLGLSICYGIVKEHGGEIHARNLEPRGACVIIELPLQSARVSEAEAATTA